MRANVVAKPARKIALPKARASEILAGAGVSASEYRHAKKAVAAAARKASLVKTRAAKRDKAVK